MMSVLQVTELLKSIVPHEDLSYNLTVYKNAFTGATIVTALSRHYGISPFEATNFARTLQILHDIFHHVVNDHIIQDTDELFFRLQCDQTPNILNSYRIWSERVDPDPMSLLRRLKKQLSDILSDHTDSMGKINYRLPFIIAISLPLKRPSVNCKRWTTKAWLIASSWHFPSTCTI